MKMFGGLTKEDVWGNSEKKTRGMIVARFNETCPIFHDKVPYKSVTVVCKNGQQAAVEYWLNYVLCCNCISKVKSIGNGQIALRADYKCW